MRHDSDSQARGCCTSPTLMPPHHHMKKRRPGNCQPNTLPTCNTISIANQPRQYTVQMQHSFEMVCPNQSAPCVCRVRTVTGPAEAHRHAVLLHQSCEIQVLRAWHTCRLTLTKDGSPIGSCSDSAMASAAARGGPNTCLHACMLEKEQSSMSQLSCMDSR